MKTFSVKLFLLSVLVSGLCSCSGHKQVVKWKELRALDDLAEFGEAYCEKKDIKSLKELVPKLCKASDELQNSMIPENAKDKAAVKQLLKDLAGLQKTLETAGKMTDSQLASTIGSFHPLVVKLMENSGLPHVHEHEEHDHEHHQ